MNFGKNSAKNFSKDLGKISEKIYSKNYKKVQKREETPFQKQPISEKENVIFFFKNIFQKFPNM